MAVLFLHKSKRASLVTFKDTQEEQKFVFFQLEKRGNWVIFIMCLYFLASPSPQKMMSSFKTINS